MEFVIETTYDQAATTAMAKALRKTVRHKHNKRSRIFGWIVIALALLLLLPIGDHVFSFNPKSVVTILVILLIFFTLLFEDHLNGYIARKRMLPGTQNAKTTFRDDGYSTETAIGNTQWKYENIAVITETKDYFVFIFSHMHAQIYPKRELSKDNVESFRSFLQEKTQKEWISLS